jgi:hypothetical protein
MHYLLTAPYASQFVVDNPIRNHYRDRRRLLARLGVADVPDSSVAPGSDASIAATLDSGAWAQC